MQMSEDELQSQLFDSVQDGYCSNCDEITDDSLEPDARDLQCPECGQHTVMGIEWAFISGFIEVSD